MTPTDTSSVAVPRRALEVLLASADALADIGAVVSEYQIGPMLTVDDIVGIRAAVQLGRQAMENDTVERHGSGGG